MTTPLPTVEEMQDILDIKDVVLWSLKWIWIPLVSVTVALSVAFFYRLRKKRRNRPLALKGPQTPLDAALHRLNHLVREGLVEAGKVRLFYFSLSEIFRDYLEEELELPAGEATLEELKGLLKASPDFTPQEFEETLWLLETSDMAKFARWVPSQEEISKSIESCGRLMKSLHHRREASRGLNKGVDPEMISKRNLENISG